MGFYNYEHYIGQRYGKLTVLSFDYERRTPNGTLRRYMRCKCDCGKIISVALHALKSNKTKSCGCIKGLKQRGYKYNYPHLYPVYDNMLKRCYKLTDENYKFYGERGIHVCEEWLNHRNNFYDWAIHHGWKIGLCLDRIDVNGNYEPDNCRFVTPKENGRNKRNNRFIVYKDKNYVFSEFCELFNIKNYRGALYRYVNLNFTAEDIIKWNGGDSAVTTSNRICK